jgi:hypothetical protein
VDRERLLGHLDDTETAIKRKELVDLLGMLDLVPRRQRDRARKELVCRQCPRTRRDSRGHGRGSRCRGPRGASGVLDARQPSSDRRPIARAHRTRRLRSDARRPSGGRRYALRNRLTHDLRAAPTPGRAAHATSEEGGSPVARGAPPPRPCGSDTATCWDHRPGRTGVGRFAAARSERSSPALRLGP